jgi:Nif-specific regulatory protein
MARAATVSPASAVRLNGSGLTTLLEIGHTLSSQLELGPALERVLRKLGSDAGVLRGAVLMLDAPSGELRVEVSAGFGPEEQRARYKPGKGIVGRSLVSGRPLVADAVGREPLFRHRSTEASREEEIAGGTFLCVPLAPDRKPVGVLAIELAREGARDPEDTRRFFALVATMITQALRVHREDEAQRDEDRPPRIEPRGEGFSGIVGVSAPMCQVCEQVARIAPADGAVLIRGEPGTGKELIAWTIHSNSPRSKKPFVKVSVGARPAMPIESELFGHEKGAFLGAVASRRGGLEQVGGGTLFLDEVGELNADAQAKLLRLLREGEFERMGGARTLIADVRIVAASNKDLEAAVAAGELRPDLHRRLSACSISVPALRDRDSDVLMLADHFLARYSRLHAKRIRRFSAAAIDMLMSYRWPGNVRELENTIERAVLACQANAIQGYHLPPALQVAEAPWTGARASLSDSVERYEKELILDALNRARGNRMHAARLLDTTERVISYKIHKYRIDPQRFRISDADAEIGDGGAMPAAGVVR